MQFPIPTTKKPDMFIVCKERKIMNSQCLVKTILMHSYERINVMRSGSGL